MKGTMISDVARILEKHYGITTFSQWDIYDYIKRYENESPEEIAYRIYDYFYNFDKYSESTKKSKGIKKFSGYVCPYCERKVEERRDGYYCPKCDEFFDKSEVVVDYLGRYDELFNRDGYDDLLQKVKFIQHQHPDYSPEQVMEAVLEWEDSNGNFMDMTQSQWDDFSALIRTMANERVWNKPNKYFEYNKVPDPYYASAKKMKKDYDGEEDEVVEEYRGVEIWLFAEDGVYGIVDDEGEVIESYDDIESVKDYIDHIVPYDASAKKSKIKKVETHEILQGLRDRGIKVCSVSLDYNGGWVIKVISDDFEGTKDDLKRYFKYVEHLGFEGHSNGIIVFRCIDEMISKKVKKSMDVDGVFDDSYQKPHGKYVLHLNLNGDSFYPKYFDDEESFNREVQRAIDNGYTESDWSNYSDNEGLHRRFARDDWGKSAKKSYTPDYKDFRSMVGSIRNTGDHNRVFKE